MTQRTYLFGTPVVRKRPERFFGVFVTDDGKERTHVFEQKANGWAHRDISMRGPVYTMTADEVERHIQTGLIDITAKYPGEVAP